MTILGISAYYHDSAAAIITDGEIVAAAQEERFSRKKNDNSFPSQSIAFCLREAGKKMADLDAVVFYDKSFLKFERLIETYYAVAPKGILSFYQSIPAWINEKIFVKKNIRRELKQIGDYDPAKSPLLFTEHHLSHAASAFYPSGFEEAAILTIDGVGEWATTTICRGSGSSIEILKEMRFPHSAGLFYSAFTYYLGFTVNSDEYKLMGLAPYGNGQSAATTRYAELIKTTIVQVFDDGSLLLNQDYFSYSYGLRMTHNSRFEQLVGFPRRTPEQEFTQQHLDLAFAVQQVTTEIVIKLARHAKQITGCRQLCMAGGVALNCVANGALQKQQIFDDIFVQPAAGDAGGALGAALATYHIHFKQSRSGMTGSDGMHGSYLGPCYSNEDILALLKKESLAYTVFPDFSALCTQAAGLLNEGKVIGWFQGKMEFGPRALGNRSILASPSFPGMQKTLNLKIKFREGFRPFAPAVPAEDASHFFDIEKPSPYMLFVYAVNEVVPAGDEALTMQEKLYADRGPLQAVTHVDGSARVQTVDATRNARFYELLKKYGEISGVPVLVNTSFNVRDEPIVCSPVDAINCFRNTGMDFLVLHDFLVSK